MSRYRSPRAKGSPYITPEGAERLRDELNTLWKIERP
ncbi:MAG: transcription elongation factor GreB, partial [Flavobacteriaceae bacterium TMED48]